MISKENYSPEHIRQLQLESKRDPGLIERSLFAFGLLEALAKVGLDFIFKGGTSLMLLLPKPMRLSTDIDIVVKPGTDIDAYIQKAAAIFPFIDGGEQKRQNRGRLEKRHFKFIYNSPVRIILPAKQNHILPGVHRPVLQQLISQSADMLPPSLRHISPGFVCMEWGKYACEERRDYLRKHAKTVPTDLNSMYLLLETPYLNVRIIRIIRSAGLKN